MGIRAQMCRCVVFVLLAGTLVAAGGAASAASTTFTVTTTADAGPGSLRQAILDANATPDTDTIVFDTGGITPFVIQPATPLPPITSAVVVDGTTTGSCGSFQGVVLSGASLTSGNSSDRIGLKITAGGSTVRGLVISRFGWAGL